MFWSLNWSSAVSMTYTFQEQGQQNELTNTSYSHKMALDYWNMSEW
jgi:hypothetical protein